MLNKICCDIIFIIYSPNEYLNYLHIVVISPLINLKQIKIIKNGTKGDYN